MKMLEGFSLSARKVPRKAHAAHLYKKVQSMNLAAIEDHRGEALLQDLHGRTVHLHVVHYEAPQLPLSSYSFKRACKLHMHLRAKA